MDERVKRVLDHIEDNLAETHSLDDLAQMACLSASQFHRLFKKETGATPFRFIEKIKLNKAHHLLINSETKVAELALNLGYNDYETFSRAFKKHFLISPDDLKAISRKIKDSLPEGETDKTLIITVDSKPDQKGLDRLLKEIIKEHHISKEDLTVSGLFFITEKGDEDDPGQNIIKNKYKMTREPRIWESLLENIRPEQYGE